MSGRADRRKPAKPRRTPPAAPDGPTGRERTEAALRESREELQVIHDSVVEGILVADVATMRFLRANPGLCCMFGYSREEIVRLSVADIHPADRLADVLRQFRDLVSGKIVVAADTPCRRKDGSLFFVDISGALMRWQGRPALVGIFRDATARRAAEEQAREADARYRAVVESTLDPIFTFDRTGRLVAANEAADRYMNMPPGGLVGKTMHEVFPPAVADRQWASVAKVFETGRPLFSEENESRTATGPRWFNTSLTPIRGPDGTVQHVVGIARDVTERKEAEAKLREGETRYRAVVETQTELVCRFLPDGTLTFVNEAVCRTVGRAREQMVGASFLAFLNEEDRADVLTVLSASSPEHPVSFSGHEARLPSGEKRWLQWTNQAFFDDRGRLTEFQGVGRDITDQKKAEEALRASEARYRAVVETQSELIVRFVAGGVLTFVNEAYCRYFGARREDLLGVSFLPWLPEEDRQPAVERFAGICLDHPVVDHEHRVTMPSGEVRWMHWINQGVFDAGGRLMEVQAVGRDVTDRKRAEDALRLSEEKFRSLFEQSVDGIVVLVDGTIVSANEAFAAMHGTTVPEAVGRPAADFIHPDERAVSAQRQAAAARGEPLTPYVRPYRDLRTDGSIILVEARSRGMTWAGRRAVQVILRNVTERARLEEELREAQKMEAVGRLAGGIAHDFNNLMTGILCHASLLKMDSRRGDPVYEGADIIEGAAKRAAELTGQLLGYARRGKHQNAPVDLHETIRAVTRLVGGSLDRRTAIRQELHADPPIVFGDPTQMEQVVLNLAMNACDAMPEGGEIVLRTETVDLREPRPCFHGAVPPGRYLVLTVTDTGEGISDDLRPHLFEPFFTTKPRGKGTGMGLAMVYGIVKNHGGYVDVRGRAGKGCEFVLYLPARAAEGAVKEGDRAPPAPDGIVRGTGRLLVVDDEAIVCDATRRMLTGLGYEVDTVADGDEAVAFYAAHRGRIDLVIIDMQMRRMDGRVCFRALREIDPHVRAIVSTGYGFDGAAQEMLNEGLAGFVQKPFEVARLSQVVAAAMRTDSDK